MTAADIFRIMSTVTITQVICDLLARRLVFSKSRYSHSLQTLERARGRRDKVLSTTTSEPPTSRTSAKAIEKHNKKIQRVEDDFAEAAAKVSKFHTTPNILTSVVFLILYRVLSADYKGKVVAVLPFQPWSLVRRLTMRNVVLRDGFDIVAAMAFQRAAAMAGSSGGEDEGAGGPLLDGEGSGGVSRVFDSTQGCGFLFVYLLSNLTVKFLVHKLLGCKPPEGADKGVLNLMDDPQGKKILATLGMDDEELKEVKRSFGSS